MKLFSYFMISMLTAAMVLPALAQERVALTPSKPAQDATGNAPDGQAALQSAAASGKYLFIFFWKDQTPQTDNAWNTLQSAMPKMSQWADVTSIQASDPKEKQLVEHFGVNRAPLPLVLAIAPSGIVTKAFSKNFDENQYASAHVSPCTEQCMKGLVDKKLVFLCVSNTPAQDNSAAIPQGVQDFKADQRYSRSTQVVLLNANDQDEGPFLKELQLDPQSTQTVSILFAPPASTIGKFDSTATKEQIVAKLVSSQSGCCPGGKCGPNGCGPKK
jgi:hypothetical protein